jgi:hypothetical protein
VLPGWNQFKLTATDKVFEATGYSEHAAEVTLFPPPPEAVDVRLTLPSDPYSSPPEQAQVELRKAGGGWEFHTLNKSSASPLVYSNADGQVTVQLEASGPLDPNAPDALSATVAAEALEVELGPVLLNETGDSTGTFDGGGTNQIDPSRRKTWVGFGLPNTAQCHKTASSSGGEDHAYLLEVVAPRTLDEWVQQMKVDEEVRAVAKANGGRLFLADRSAGAKPAVFRLKEMARNGEVFRRATVKNPFAFHAGMAKGLLVDGAFGLVEDVGLFIWKNNSIRLTIDLITGAKMEEIKQNQKIAAGVLEVVGPIVRKVIENDVATVEAVLSGNEAQLNAVGEDWRIMLEYLGEFFAELSLEMVNMSDFEKGELVGKVGFEVLTTVFSGGGAQAAKASKLATLQKMERLPFFTGNTPAGRAFTRFAAFIRRLETTRMCFVAGTEVHTANGLVDIEDVRPGDLVLSRDEATGEQAYKPVLQTVTTHPDALYTVVYDTDGAGPVPPAELVTTAPHPFYVVGKGFVPASDLRDGDDLSLADGATADVVALTVERALPGESFTTYNFEVAEFHTYFVDAEGVWVHNAGRAFCERLKSLFERFLKASNNDVWGAHTAAMSKFDGLAGADPRLGQGGVARLQMLTEARRRYFTDMAASATTAPPWRTVAGQTLTRTSPPAATGAMAAELAENMRAIYGVRRPLGFSAHHIVPTNWQNPLADQLRQLLATHGIHLNEAANGVYVAHMPNAITAYGEALGRHGPLQGEGYLQAVWERLNAVQQPDGQKLRDALQKIAFEISENRLL